MGLVAATLHQIQPEWNAEPPNSQALMISFPAVNGFVYEKWPIYTTLSPVVARKPLHKSPHDRNRAVTKQQLTFMPSHTSCSPETGSIPNSKETPPWKDENRPTFNHAMRALSQFPVRSWFMWHRRRLLEAAFSFFPFRPHFRQPTQSSVCVCPCDWRSPLARARRGINSSRLTALKWEARLSAPVQRFTDGNPHTHAYGQTLLQSFPWACQTW